MVGIIIDDDAATMRDYVRSRASRGRSGSTRTAAASLELRHDRSTRDVCDRAGRRRGVRQPRSRRRRPSSTRGCRPRGPAKSARRRRPDDEARNVRAVARARTRRRRRRRRARGALPARQLARGPRRTGSSTSSRARCATASRSPTATRRRPRRSAPTSRAASPPASPTREIRAAYVALYSEKILETPSNSGLGIVAWGLPGARADPRCAWASASRVRRWSHAPRSTATDEDEDIVRRARRRTRSRGDQTRADDRRPTRRRATVPSREELEDEREFLLRSLDDLDS